MALRSPEPQRHEGTKRGRRKESRKNPTHHWTSRTCLNKRPLRSRRRYVRPHRNDVPIGNATSNGTPRCVFGGMARVSNGFREEAPVLARTRPFTSVAHDRCVEPERRTCWRCNLTRNATVRFFKALLGCPMDSEKRHRYLPRHGHSRPSRTITLDQCAVEKRGITDYRKPGETD